MDEVWRDMFEKARHLAGKRDVSSRIQAGSVAACVESASRRFYTGVCVDTKCHLGICAERSALVHMIADGESAVRRVLAVRASGKVIPPCGACREFLAELMPKSYKSVEVMLDYAKGTIVTLGELTPHWWF